MAISGYCRRVAANHSNIVLLRDLLQLCGHRTRSAQSNDQSLTDLRPLGIRCAAHELGPSMPVTGSSWSRAWVYFFTGGVLTKLYLALNMKRVSLALAVSLFS